MQTLKLFWGWGFYQCWQKKKAGEISTYDDLGPYDDKHKSVRELVVCCLVAKLCLTLCDPMDCSPQAPLSMRFPRQDYWSGLSLPPPGDLSNPGTEHTYPTLVGGFFTTVPPGKSKNWGTARHLVSVIPSNVSVEFPSGTFGLSLVTLRVYTRVVTVECEVLILKAVGGMLESGEILRM